MILGTLYGHKDRYCDHTCPRYFHALHYYDSDEEEESIEILGKKISNKFALFILGLIATTWWWLIVSINFFIKQLGGKGIIKDNRIVNDYRCENCKKEAAAQ